jgi:two-component system phosphate regulon sensor histidine kinase PhoR
VVLTAKKTMPSSRLFWKLLFACAGVNLIATVAIGFILGNWIERELLEQMDRRLRDSALLIRAESAALLANGASEELQRLVRHFGESTGLRFTLISSDGSVLADSEKETLEDVQRMDNHRDRPELLRAKSHGEGSANRLSATLEEPYHYFAVRADVDGSPVGFIRSAVPVGSIRTQVAHRRRIIWGLICAAFLGVLAVSNWIIGAIVNPISTVTQAAKVLAAGDYQQRVYVPRRDEFGDLAATFNQLGQDLNTRMKQLGQSNERHATVLGGMIEGVIAVDARQRIVLANRAAGRLFDFRPAAVEGRPLLEVVRNHALDQAVSAALASGQPQRLETGRDGDQKLTTDIHVTPLAGDPCPGVVLVMHDVSELRRLETLRRDFIANVSHELKTPLSSIKACAETLRNGALSDPDATQRFLARIEEQSDRLNYLIRDMLSLARIESGQQAFEIGPLDVGEVVNGRVEMHRQAAEARRIQLSIEPGSPSCRVRAEREGLEQILDNLLDNAIKYTPEGGLVTVRWRAADSVVRIEVEDNGIGIREEDRKRVFERFYRVDKARSRELGGTGLGLAIVKHLVQSFGGEISVESEPGEGSTFFVELLMA